MTKCILLYQDLGKLARQLFHMHFEMGKGLGKNKQGITTPVEAVKRKGTKAGVAFHGTERSERSLIDFPVQDEEEKEEKEFKEQLSQWKKEPEVRMIIRVTDKRRICVNTH